MKALLLAPLAGLLLCAPALAQSAPACETLAKITAQLDAQKTPHVEIDPKDLIGVTVPHLHRILFTVVGGMFVMGLEVDGCVSSPIPIAAASTVPDA